VSLHHGDQLTSIDHGLLQVYDLHTLKMVGSVSTGGLQPHEVHLIPNTRELAVTHYGDIFPERRPFEHNVVDAKLTILDADTLEPKRHYPQHDLNGMVTHTRVDDQGWAYFVLTQYVRWPRARSMRSAEDPFAEASRLLDGVMGESRDFPLPYQVLEDRMLPSRPIRAGEHATGERQLIDAGVKLPSPARGSAYE
jgi:hypothetical protein